MSDGAIRVLCPKTRKPVGVGISVGDARSLRDAEMTGNSFGCPACGQTHTWDKAKGDTLAVVRP